MPILLRYLIFILSAMYRSYSMSQYTAYRDGGWFSDEVELSCHGDYIPSEPTITHPIDMAQEGTQSCIECLTVYQVYAAGDEKDITHTLTTHQLDELNAEMTLDWETD
jgi:hypothetical protein